MYFVQQAQREPESRYLDGRACRPAKNEVDFEYITFVPYYLITSSSVIIDII